MVSRGPASRPIRLTKRGHACVELERGSTRILIDPGTLGDEPDLDGIAAVLVSHGHYDHASRVRLERAVAAGTPVFGPADLADQVGSDLLASRMTAVSPGEQLDIAGFVVTVAGGHHAAVHPDRPGPANLAFLIDGRILVTGDEHPVPDIPISVLVTPVDAPWLRAVDLITYVRRVRPDVVVGVHDGLLNADGLVVADAVLASLTREGARTAFRLRPGEEFLIGDGTDTDGEHEPAPPAQPRSSR